jgi:beta-lactamase regulating signal transducer with metallopeptidase domain
VATTVAGLYPSVTHWVIPAILMILGVFVSFIQTFVFILLSQLYLSEVSHAPHGEHDADATHDEARELGLAVVPY